MDVQAQKNRSKILGALFAIALVAAVFLLYKSSWHGGFVFDDDLHLLDNPVLKPGGLARIWVPGSFVNYWPITSAAYWLQFQLWGLQPLGYHLVNLGVHALSALLVWRVLVRLQVPGAMLAAAIFALHPVNVESVAWIAQLKGLLSLVFALVSVLFYLSNERHPSRWRYCLAIAAFLFSALAKGAVITLPVVLLACAWWQRGRIERRDWLRVAPYFLIAALMSALELWMQHYAAQGELVRTDGFLNRAAIAGCAVWFYLGKLVFPRRLCPVYPGWTIENYGAIWYLPGLILGALFACARWQRRTWGRPVVMSIVCYMVLLLPVLGFANIYFMRYSLVADHWQYIAMIVPCALFAATSSTLARRFVGRPAAICAAVALVSVLAALSFRQSGMYQDAETFYETIIERNPSCWLAEDNLGDVLSDRGQVDLAISHFRRALAIKPDYDEAHYNLAVALAGRGQLAPAIVHYERALETNPGHAEAHNNLAAALYASGQYDLAVLHFQKALDEIKPENAGIHNNLALALAGSGQLDAAIAHYQRALEINPNFAEARANLAAAISRRGGGGSVNSGDLKTRQIAPDDAATHCNLATDLARKGEASAAIAEYQKALEVNPDYALAHNNLGVVLISSGQAAAGIPHLRRAIEIQPSYAEAHFNLANALAPRGEFDAAIAEYEKALAIKPDYVAAQKNLAAVRSAREKALKAKPGR